MKLLGEFLLDPAWHCNVVNNPIMLAPSLLQGSIGKSRKGNLAWDTNLFLGGAVLPTSRQNSGGVIKLPLIILLQIQKLCSFLSRPYFFVITIHHNFSHDNTVCHWRWLMVFSKRRQLKLIWLIFESDLKI